MPPKKHLKITNAKHIRRLLATTINKLLNDEIDAQIANSIASLCTVMLKTLKASNLEERLDKLEKLLELENNNKTQNPVVSDLLNLTRKLKEQASGG